MTDTPETAAAEMARLQATVDEHRALLADRPDSLFPLFADALVGLGALLAEQGRVEEGLAAAQEGVDHYRHLHAADAGLFGVHLASGLNSLSNRLGETGREDEGRRVCDEAIQLAGEALSGASGMQARFVLVSSLMNQSGRSWKMGEPERAIEEMAMAVDAFRDGGEALSQFLGVIVDSLHKNAMALAEVGRWGEAIAIRRLTARVFPPDQPVPAPVGHLLALTLEQAAFARSRDGKAGEALPLVEEAVQIARDLAGADAETYTVFLGQTLSNLASRQFEAGAPTEALDACMEAIQLFQDAAQTNAADVVLPLSMTLETFASILISLGHEEQAQSVLAQRDELMEVVRQVEGLDHDHDHGPGCGCH